jgi:hypothetical protein
MFNSIDEIINYYLQNPPFEIDENNKLAYQNIIEKSIKQTLLEISENDPIIDEKIFKTPEKNEENKNITDDNYILVDVYKTIDERFMSFIILCKKEELPQFLYRFTGRYVPVNDIGKISFYSLISDDALYIISQYTWKIIERIFIKDRYIKLEPDTEYYTMYRRYRDYSELPPHLQRCFLELFEINLGLSYYNSYVYSSDNLFRSFSISGLSISLNPPSVERASQQLQKLKYQKLSECMDYGDLIESI